MPGFERVLIVTAVEPERAAVLAGLGPHGAGGRVVAVAGGVGPAEAAASTARLLTRAECEGRPFDAVLSAGVGGGFAGRADVGGLVIADRSVAADLGAEDGDGFIDIETLGFGRGRRTADERLLTALRTALPGAVVAPVVTVTTATGSAARTAALAGRVPGAAAEGMEGFGVAVAAEGVAFGELRAISNVVGPRDRSAWRIPQALARLRETFAALAA
ncbi:futalosine hydrolase [Dactylosporangium roseum]|uniref:Futalosine hydrolase n=1 Tax=Dactylosporangium roseum TaxID=47989 RepID=A0ABY5ZF61_9ACTN|nr:futalosine hydrolase [Dactylosporangium roseum]